MNNETEVIDTLPLAPVKDALNRQLGDLETGTDPLPLIELRDRIIFALSMLKEFKERCEDRLVVVLGKDEIQVGDKKFWASDREKSVKCIDVPGTFDALLQVSGGDQDLALKMLASNPFRHGACSKVLKPEDFERLFQTTWSTKLKVELVEVDTRFLSK